MFVGTVSGAGCTYLPIPEYLLDEMEDLKTVLSQKDLKGYRNAFETDPKNILAMNACNSSDPIELCVKHSIADSTPHVFTHKIDSEVKPVTNQKSSGRCWIFAALNVLRIPFMKEYEIEEFEFSQNYLFFWDKIERCNYFLHKMCGLLLDKEPIDGRLVSYLLKDPISDGGQWDMVMNIISKYGVVPKINYPDTFSSECSSKLNGILKSKIREYVRELKLMVDEGASSSQLVKIVKTYMEELYRIIAICLGVPPSTFTFEYYSKHHKCHALGPITPLKFYEDYVQPHCFLQSKVCVVNDPRPENPYYQTYTVEFLGNMMEGRSTIYVNAPIEDLLKAGVESIRSDEPVWFGCEVGKLFYGKGGVQDLEVLDYNLVFGVEVGTGMNKAERLLYGDTSMNHAMVITGVSLDPNGLPTKWRVENSWGEDKGNKGYLVMTTDWFKEFVFEVVVDKKFCSAEVLAALDKKPKILPAWDPMGSLA